MNAPERDVFEMVGGGYMVRSKSVEGAWRLVFGRSCSCPAGGRRSCRHRRLVEVHCRRIDEQFARPAAPVNVSALVD